MATHYMQARSTSGGVNQLVGSLGVRGVAAVVAGLDFSQNQPDSRGDDVDPNPDYDASDELEYGFNWFAWILRGVYPPPAYPPV
jgi:hypothetical protein